MTSHANTGPSTPASASAGSIGGGGGDGSGGISGSGDGGTVDASEVAAQVEQAATAAALVQCPFSVGISHSRMLPDLHLSGAC
jgi:hypothetical protein